MNDITPVLYPNPDSLSFVLFQGRVWLELSGGARVLQADLKGYDTAVQALEGMRSPSSLSYPFTLAALLPRPSCSICSCLLELLSLPLSTLQPAPHIYIIINRYRYIYYSLLSTHQSLTTFIPVCAQRNRRTTRLCLCSGATSSCGISAWPRRASPKPARSSAAWPGGIQTLPSAPGFPSS